MAGIRSALDGVVSHQTALEITLENGDTQKLNKAYKYPPDRKVALAAPCVVNFWSFPEQDAYLAQEVHRYTIQSQWFIYDGSVEQAGDLCAQWWEAWLNRWVANQRLAVDGVNTVLGARIRGDDPTFAALEWGSKTYPGMTTYLDVQIERA